MLILHQNSELSGLSNAPDICGIPVLEPWIESVTRGAARVARGPSLQFREAGQECPDWGLVQNPGPWIWVQDSWFSVFNPNFHSSVEIRIRTQNHREFQYELIRSPDYTLTFYGVGIIVVHVLCMYSTVQLLQNDWNPFSNSTEILSIRIAIFLLVYRV